MSHITIYHNPACGTSRNTLEMIRNSGTEPEIILYLDNPPSRDELTGLIADMGISIGDLLRKNVEPYEQLGLSQGHFTDDQLIDFMLQYPILINRPIVVTPLGTRLCRPSEAVLDILPDAQKGAFTKEDGEVVVDASGKKSPDIRRGRGERYQMVSSPAIRPTITRISSRVNGDRSVTKCSVIPR